MLSTYLYLINWTGLSGDLLMENSIFMGYAAKSLFFQYKYLKKIINIIYINFTMTLNIIINVTIIIKWHIFFHFGHFATIYRNDIDF